MLGNNLRAKKHLDGFCAACNIFPVQCPVLNISYIRSYSVLAIIDYFICDCCLMYRVILLMKTAKERSLVNC